MSAHENLKGTINRLKEILKDPNCERMSKSNIVGYLGELYIFDLLNSGDGDITQKGKQASCDLVYNEISIDVKTSTLKSEFKNNITNWGWNLKKRNKETRCDVFVCVRLEKDFNIKDVYIIHSNDIGKLQSPKTGQFNSGECGLRVLEDQNCVADIKESPYYNITYKPSMTYIIHIESTELNTLGLSIKDICQGRTSS